MPKRISSNWAGCQFAPLCAAGIIMDRLLANHFTRSVRTTLDDLLALQPSTLEFLYQGPYVTLASKMNVTLHLAGPEDDDFLPHLCAVNCFVEMQATGWNDARIETFARTKYSIRK